VACEIQPSDIFVESIVAQRENLPLSRFSDRIVLQEYCEACFCLFSLTLVIIDYMLDHVPIDRFHSIFSLWQLEGITSPFCLLIASHDHLPSSFYGERCCGVHLYQINAGISTKENGDIISEIWSGTYSGICLEIV